MDENLMGAPDPGGAGDRQAPRKRAIWKSPPLLMVLGIIVVIGIALLCRAALNAREAGRRIRCANQLVGVTIALHLYAAAHGGFPPAYTTDADGKPLHSWRTLILPYLERQQLYASIDLTKPWDDPVNAKACGTVVSDYQCPSTFRGDNRTTYLAIVTPESCFRATEPRSLSEITDGNSRTLMVIEVDPEHAVPWMAPIDADEAVVLGIGKELKPAHAGGFVASFVDGRVLFLPGDLTAAQRRALISIAGDDDAAISGQY